MAKSKVITLTVPEKLLKAIDRRAKRDGTTRAELFRSGCRRVLDDEYEAEYWEDEKGNFGLRFPHGMRAGDFVNLMDDFEQREMKAGDGKSNR